MIMCFLNPVEYFWWFWDSFRIKYEFACKWNIIGPWDSLYSFR